MSENLIQNGPQSDSKTASKPLERINSCLKTSNIERTTSITSGESNKVLIKKSNISFKDPPPIVTTLSNQKVSSGSSLNKPPLIRKSKVYYHDKNIILTEDSYNKISNGRLNNGIVKKFTWKNHNNIEVQIITYGARIISMKIPDKKGDPDDIVLGFDKPGDYITYGQHFFGATIGRVTGPIENSTYIIDGKQYWVDTNEGLHHMDGGPEGLDKVIWNSSVINSKVILSHVTQENHAGFPGELFVEITFELSPKNEFHISMVAKSTKPTVINLSNLCYFNLGGHNAGKPELHKHYVTINSHEHIDIDEDNLPSGLIEKSACTQFDFQVPVLLRKIMRDGNGFDSHFCVNKDLDEGDMSFVARALHTPSGRTLEIYSNQPSVRFTTGNDFEAKLTTYSKSKIPSAPAVAAPVDSAYNTLFGSEGNLLRTMTANPEENFMLIVNVYERLKQLDTINESNFIEVLDLFKQIHTCDMDKLKNHFFTADLFKDANLDIQCYITAVLQTLGVVKIVIPSTVSIMDTWSELGKVVQKVSAVFKGLDTTVKGFTRRNSSIIMDKKLPREKVESTLQDFQTELSGILLQQVDSKIIEADIKNAESATKKVRIPSKEKMEDSNPSSIVKIGTPPSIMSEVNADWLWGELQDRLLSYIVKKKSVKSMKMKPSSYFTESRDGKVVGKNGVVYTKHSGMAFQTQNFPNAIYHGNFPNSVLKPGDTYQHKITYKFWVQSGSPKKWMKRYADSQ